MDSDEKKPLLNMGGGQAEAAPTAPPLEPPPYEEPSVPGISEHLCQHQLIVTRVTHPLHTQSLAAPYTPQPGDAGGLPPPYSSTNQVSPTSYLCIYVMGLIHICTLCYVGARVWPEPVCAVSCVSACDPCCPGNTEQSCEMLQLQRGNSEFLMLFVGTISMFTQCRHSETANYA